MRVFRRASSSIGVAATTIAMIGAFGIANAQSLNDAGKWALRASLAYEADNQRQSAARAKLRGALEAFLPRVTWEHERILDGKILYTPDFSAVSNSFYGGIDSVPRRQPNSWGAQLSLPIFDGFKRYNDLQAAKSAVQEGVYLNIDKRQQVLLETASAYLAVLRDRQIVAHRRELLNSLTAIAKRVGVQFAVRDATSADFALAQSRVQAARGALEAANASLATSQIELERLTQTNMASLAQPVFHDQAIPDTPELLDRATRAQSPKIRAAHLGAEAAAHLADTAYAPLLPQVNLVASRIDQTDITQIQQRIRDTTVKLQIKIPIYEPGAFSGVSEARALAARKRFESLDLERQVVAANRALYETRRAVNAQIIQARQRIVEVQRVVDGYKIERDAGFRTVIDVLNVQGELTEARIAKANLEFNRDRLAYTIAATLGRLDVADALP